MAVNFPLIMPVDPTTRVVKIGGQSVVGMAQSPFTLQQQTQEWDGDMWTLSASLPVIKDRLTAERWITMLLALRRNGTFLWGDPKGRAPMGVATGVPQILGAGQTGKSLATRGWNISLANILRAGDYLQLSKNYVFAPTAFDDASWVKVTATIAANSQSAPDGTATADRLTATAGNASILQTITNPSTIVGRTFTFVIWLKASTGTPTVRLVAIRSGASGLLQTVTLSTTWTQFIITGVIDAATEGNLQVGVDSIGNGILVDLWGAALSSQQLDARLHKVLNDASSDGSGNVTLDIWPRLREATTDFARIYTVNPVGTFRLAQALREWTLDQALTYGIDFQAIEAL